MIYYYLSVFPVESFIASQLEPVEFGSYMAVGNRKGSNENLIFARVKGEFGDFFDWKFAQEKCTPHADGRPKNSLYLSVYRVLENIPLDQLDTMYLVTQDGRCLELQPGAYQPPPAAETYVYKEFCPISPIVVSSLAPDQFGDYLTSGQNLIHVPRVIYANLKVADPDDPVNTGNVGPTYEKRLDHLRECIEAVTGSRGKVNKTFNRSNTESFTYQVISSGIYVADSTGVLAYPMKTEEQLRQDHYDWARSAQIL
jgi:hypothetical protein